MGAEYFMSLDDGGKIVLLCEAYPPHELTQDQVELTEAEFRLLKALPNWMTLRDVHRLVHAIEKKIRNADS